MSLPADYQAALDIIFNYTDYERRRSVPYDEVAWDLARTRRVLAALGNPHEGLRFVHVAGSKGKGSTAAMIESVLRAAGYRTGFYTSPHLHTFRERIRVDGRLLRRDDLVRLLQQCRPAIEAVPGITTFEIITVLALLHFAQTQVDWAVLEVGLGGRLDSTNVVTPAVCVITPISLEHTALLGDTVAEIAAEKAGIIKPGVPVVVAPQPADGMAVVEEVCRERGSPLIAVGRHWQWQALADGLDGQEFEVLHNQAPFAEFRIPLLGAYQLANATTAVAACATLAAVGVAVDEAALRRGLAAVVWPGRLEVLRRPGRAAPAVVVDSAHTAASAALLRAALNGYFPGKSLRLVIGVSGDKDLAGLLAAVVPGVDRLVATRSRHPRAADPALVAQAAGLWLPSERLALAPTVAEGMALALDGAGADHVICAAGSLFVAAEAREAWLASDPDSLPADDWARQAEPAAPDWQVTQVLPTSEEVRV